MKTCQMCNERKDLALFGKDASKEDGLSYRCKECVNAVRRVKREAIAATKSPDWKKKTQDIEAYRKAWREAHPGYSTAKKKEWYSKHKDRLRVKDAVKYALRTGKLVKTPCQVCGELEVQGHHPDYSRPLDVVWLCRKHHHEIHTTQQTELC